MAPIAARIIPFKAIRTERMALLTYLIRLIPVIATVTDTSRWVLLIYAAIRDAFIAHCIHSPIALFASWITPIV